MGAWRAGSEEGQFSWSCSGGDGVSRKTDAGSRGPRNTIHICPLDLWPGLVAGGGDEGVRVAV